MMQHISNTEWLELLPGSIAIKSKKSHYNFANKKTCQLAGYKNYEAFHNAGATDHVFNCPAVEFAEGFISEDRMVIETEEPLKILGRYDCADDDWKLFLGEKNPYYGDGNTVNGVICQYLNITDFNIINTYMLIHKDNKKFISNENVSYYLTKSHGKLNLTARQVECLYYLLRGKSFSEIGLLLAISKRTVEDHVERIKDKLSCRNKQELIEKAIHRGFINIIPESIVNKDRL